VPCISMAGLNFEGKSNQEVAVGMGNFQIVLQKVQKSGLMKFGLPDIFIGQIN